MDKAEQVIKEQKKLGRRCEPILGIKMVELTATYSRVRCAVVQVHSSDEHKTSGSCSGTPGWGIFYSFEIALLDRTGVREQHRSIFLSIILFAQVY